jgi:D-glycero-beta-D-manno-heptose-7-phosphate kinase
MLISEERIKQIFSTFSGKTIAVIGDLMLDRYFWGNVNRISPEAPVPVVEVESESIRLGGAANVANNIKSLSATPILFGVVGKDENANKLMEIATASGFNTDGIIRDIERPTTVKTRVIAHSQHVVRIDQELRRDIAKEIQDELLKILENKLPKIDGIIIEDYNKGVLCREFIKNLIYLGNKFKKIITVDPKFNNFFEFKNVTVFKPNRQETEEALGMKLNDNRSIEVAGKKLLEELKAKSIIITRGEYGISIFSDVDHVHHLPTTARKVADVSGAGDTVISTLTVAIAAGSTLLEAAVMANTAGGIVCGEVGIAPINKEELFKTLLEDMNHKPKR